MTELLFLGTGPAEAIPRNGHDDALCRDAQKPRSKSRRLRSSALVKKGETRVLIDAGPDLAYQLATHRVDRIDAVFLTHAHLDAAGGLDALDAWAARRGEKLTVYTERATERRYGPHRHLRYRFVRPGQAVKVGAIFARFFRVSHSLKPGFPTLGVRIGHTAYASDLFSVPKSALALMEGIETMILDAAFWFGRTFRGHMTPDKSVSVARKLGVRRLILTQTGHTYPPHDEAEKEVRRYARERAPGTDVAIAYDGMRIRMR